MRERASDAGYFEIAVEVDGDGDEKLEKEAGGHRIQRVPPTERNGRVHTSTVTVAVMGRANIGQRLRHPEDFKVRFYSGTGKGGQKRNKVQSCVSITHVPTGLSQNANGRSRIANEEEAMALLNARLDELDANTECGQRNDIRSAQIGTGMRGDKVRTYRFQDGIISDHRTGKTISAKDLNRSIEKLW